MLVRRKPLRDRHLNCAVSRPLNVAYARKVPEISFIALRQEVEETSREIRELDPGSPDTSDKVIKKISLKSF